jgi:hypothetical protein
MVATPFQGVHFGHQKQGERHRATLCGSVPFMPFSVSVLDPLHRACTCNHTGASGRWLCWWDVHHQNSHVHWLINGRGDVQSSRVWPNITFAYRGVSCMIQEPSKPLLSRSPLCRVPLVLQSRSRSSALIVLHHASLQLFRYTMNLKCAANHHFHS